MKLAIEAERGESLAKSVPDVVAAVMAAAISEGASKDDVRESIAKAIGASSLQKAATHDPKWGIIREVNEAAGEVYATMMERCVSDISALLEEAQENADRSRYMERVKAK